MLILMWQQHKKGGKKVSKIVSTYCEFDSPVVHNSASNLYFDLRYYLINIVVGLKRYFHYCLASSQIFFRDCA